jgi:hypothetical protein
LGRIEPPAPFACEVTADITGVSVTARAWRLADHDERLAPARHSDR